jgi:FkbM family methyltransferase
MAHGPISFPIRAMIRELSLGWPRMADAHSAATFAAAVLAYRVAKIWPRLLSAPIWTLKLKNGILVSYGWNRGDFQGIREVLLEECYRLPVDINPRTFIDLGANIGLATLYFHNKFALSTSIAVEPSRRNVALMKKNFLDNTFEVMTLEAAVADSAGHTLFVETQESNLGYVASHGKRVNAVTMSDLIDMVPNRRIDLLKIDIEGYEEHLLSQNIEWLDSIGSIIIELHFERSKNDKFINLLISKGFTYFPPRNRDPKAEHFSDFFLRDNWRF